MNQHTPITDAAARATTRRPRRPATAPSIAAMHGYAYDDSPETADAMALAAGYTRRMLNRLAQRPNPQVRDWFMTLETLDLSLNDYISLELAAIVECLSHHDADWFDEDHLDGTHLEFLEEWGMTPEDAEDAIDWLRVLNRYTVESLFLGPSPAVQEPWVGELLMLIVSAATAIRHAGRRYTWYTACRRCPHCQTPAQPTQAA